MKARRYEVRVLGHNGIALVTEDHLAAIAEVGRLAAKGRKAFVTYDDNPAKMEQKAIKQFGKDWLRPIP